MALYGSYANMCEKYTIHIHVYICMLYICTYKNYTYYGQYVDNYGQVVIIHIHTNVYNICECTYISYTRYLDNI
jgi:hypothetical protein